MTWILPTSLFLVFLVGGHCAPATNFSDPNWWNTTDIMCLMECGSQAGARAGMTMNETMAIHGHWNMLKALNKMVMNIRSIDACVAMAAGDKVKPTHVPSHLAVCKFHTNGNMASYNTCLAACPKTDVKEMTMDFIEDVEEQKICQPGCNGILDNLDAVITCSCDKFKLAKTALDANPNAAMVTQMCGYFETAMTCAKPKAVGCPYMIKAMDKFFEQPKEIAQAKGCTDTLKKLDAAQDELEGKKPDVNSGTAILSASLVTLLLAAVYSRV